MLTIIRILPLWFLARAVCASPFDLTEKYVKEYQDGIDNLVELSKKTVLQEDTYDSGHYDEESALKNAEEFDFVVVGAGSAGAVIANRLTEVPEWSVLLLEAGAPETPYGQPPSMTATLLNTPYNWGYKSEPQEKACRGSNDDRCSVNLGRAMGGTSAINRMLYTRGNAKDYDIWADLGNDGWCYRDVLPFFKKSEDAHLHHFDRKHHSQGGLLNVEERRHDSHLRKAFLRAGHDLGYKTVDPNGEDQIGFAVPQLTTRGGRRSSVSRAYLEGAKDRKNLSVRPFSQVVQILIAPHTKEAQGVKYVHHGKLFAAKARKEVVVSAGALNTPQLLMLSGIGPKEHLERVGLDCHQDLPVGHNLKDKIAFIGLNFVSNETPHETRDHKENLVNWLKDGKGPHSDVGIEAMALLKTQISKDLHDYPDVELILLPHPLNVGHEALKNEFNLRKELYDSIWAPNEGKAGCTVLVGLPHPKSTGIVKLRSKDPLKYPVINANYLTDEEQVDRDTILAGIGKALALAQTEPWQKMGLELNKRPILGCADVEYASDEYWKCALSHLTVSLSVPSGTCKMGPETDKEAVVDNQLRVKGVHKLRVADASVIPNTLTAHTAAPEVMIGEKASELIKHQWK